jgi:hypothetical protein
VVHDDREDLVVDEAPGALEVVELGLGQRLADQELVGPQATAEFLAAAGARRGHPVLVAVPGGGH